MKIKLVEKWSKKYKQNIDCNNPKGFSQKQYCKRQRRGGQYKKLKEIVNSQLFTIAESLYDYDERMTVGGMDKYTAYNHSPNYSPLTVADYGVIDEAKTVNTELGKFEIEDKLAPEKSDLFVSHWEFKPNQKGEERYEKFMQDIEGYARFNGYKRVVLEIDVTQGADQRRFFEYFYKLLGYKPFEGDPSLLYKKVEYDDLEYDQRVSKAMRGDFKRVGEDLEYFHADDASKNDYQIGLTEDDMNEPFKLERFKDLNSFAARKRYADKHLEFIGVGSGRRVYGIDDKKVLKLALNNKGVAQNQNEKEMSLDSYVNDILAKAIDWDGNHLWLVSERVKRTTPNRFKQITGVDIKDMGLFLRNYDQLKWGKKKLIDQSKEMEEEMYENEFVGEVISLMDNWDVSAGDFDRVSSFGEIDRGSGTEIVISDYGLTKDTFDTHYAPKRRRFEQVSEDGTTLYITAKGARDYGEVPMELQEALVNNLDLGLFKIKGTDIFLNGNKVADIFMSDRTFSGDRYYFLSEIRIAKEARGQKIFSRFMRALTNHADENNIIIALTPDPSIEKNNIPKSKLVQVYSNFDFVSNKGKNKDYNTMDTMIRYPKNGMDEMVEDIYERVITFQPNSKAVTIKKNCRLGGNPDGTSDACNQGDIEAVELTDLD
jgi:hypothetical protein